MTSAAEAATPALPRLVCCLGASAGGLRALESFFQHMPADSGCSFVVVQHLSPDFKSLMDDLLSRQTRMRIQRVEEGMILEPDCVYLIPPKKLMTVRGSVLALTEREAERPGLLPIDIFLRSLAADRGSRAVCVILSGTGSDGTDGARAVRDAGGLVIVQTPGSAEFDGMPRSAISAGAADYVIPPERMPEAIAAYLGNPSSRLHFAPDGADANAAGAEDREYVQIFNLLRAAFGLDFAHYKIATVERRIRRRMTMLGLGDVPAYVDHLAIQSSELDALYRDLLIGVTEFFRDPQAFDALAEHAYRPMLRAPGREEIRVWVAGCASGEEAYSHAILLDELARETGYAGRISIFATDAHRSSIESAALGVFSRERLAGLPAERVARYFREEKNNLFRILPDIRQRIVFAPHNLLNDPPFTKLDAVSCRNLLIYLSPEAQERVISVFHYALRREGALFLGLSEGLGRLENDFGVIDAKGKIFRKTRDSRLPQEIRPSGHLHAPRPPSVPVAAHGAAPNALPKGLLVAYDHLLAQYAPPGFIVGEDAEILHYIGDSARLLLPQSGRATANVLQRTEGDLRLALSTLIPKAARSRAPALAHGVRARRGDGSTELLDVSVHPLPEDRSGAPLLHVALRGVQARPSTAEAVIAPETAPFASADAQARRIADLEAELQTTKENLQSTVEELQTTNEELQASNEEMLAANEELQSTNEELHSVNEELYTVNAEFEHKNTELKLLNADLDNLFNATNVATVFLDRSLRIRKFNPGIETFFHLLPQDVGRPISHIAYHLDDQAGMLAELQEVLATGVVKESEVRTREGRWLLKRAHPFHTHHRAIEGVVLTFTDIDLIKKMQDKLDLAMVSSRLVWWEWHLAEDLLATHASGWCILGYSVECLSPTSATWFNLTHPDDLRRVRATLDDCLLGRSPAWECEHRLKDRTGGWRWVLNKGRVTERDASGRPLRMLGTTQDVHDRHQARSELAKLHHAIEQTAVSVVITDSTGAIEYVNPFFTQTTGYSEAEVLGKNPRVLKSSENPAEVYAQLWSTITAGDTWRGELINRRKDGAPLLERVTIAPVKDDNEQITHFIAVKEDITAAKTEETRRARLEHQLAQSQKMETLGTLAGGIAHDFNNLLTSILGYTSLAQAELPAAVPAEHSARVCIRRIEQAGNRAADLVRRILAFSRHHPLSQQAVEMGRLCGESMPILRASLPATIELAYADTSAGACVLGDPAQLQQVLINLCTNAAHAIGDKAGRIKVDLSRYEVDAPFPVEAGAVYSGPYVRLCVSDDGSGISPGDLEHIFEPFFTTKEAGKGTGLGLSIVLNTVVSHRGAIAVQTVAEKGCTFQIYLPRAKDARADAEEIGEKPAPAPGGGERIAIVDDDESIAQLNLMALEQAGYRGSMFADAAGCLAALRADPRAFDLVLTDQTMPGMTGIELARELRGLGNAVPILLISGYTRLLNAEELGQIGRCAFLSKPFSLEALLKTARDLLSEGTT